MSKSIQPHSHDCPVGTLVDGAGNPVKLATSLFDVDINGRLAIITHTQTFCNSHSDPLEISYAIPKPASSAILGANAELAGTKVTLTAKRVKEAEQIYEEMRVQGNLPVILQDLGDDILALYLGSLAGNEKAKVTVIFVMPLTIADSSGTLRIPTAIAPRYGTPRNLDQAVLTSEQSLTATHPLQLTVNLWGAMQQSKLSIAHRQLGKAKQHSEYCSYELSESTYADRDIELTLDDIWIGAIASVCHDSVHGEDIVWIDVVDSSIPDPKPRKFHILADCSGSMHGDSANSVQQVLQHLSLEIQDNDEVGFSHYGTTWESICRRTTWCDLKEDFNELIYQRISGDMGGTELALALEETMQIEDKGTDIVLLTDGLVHQGIDIVNRMHKRGHRVFIAGMGSSPQENFLRELAQATEGMAIMVSSRRSTVKAAKQLANLTAATRHRIADIDWRGSPPEWHSQLPQTIFRDTPLPVIARYTEQQQCPSSVLLHLDNAETIEVHLRRTVGQGEAYSKLLAQRQYLFEFDRKSRENIALKYGLATDSVTLVGCIEREKEKVGETVSTVIRPMLAAGYGGSGIESRQGQTKGQLVLASIKPFYHEPILRNNAPVAAYQMFDARTFPRKCPKRFLDARDSYDVRASLSWLLSKIWDQLIKLGWHENEIHAALKHVVEYTQWGHVIADPIMQPDKNPDVLIKLFQELISEDTRPESWRINADALLDRMNFPKHDRYMQTPQDNETNARHERTQNTIQNSTLKEQ